MVKFLKTTIIEEKKLIGKNIIMSYAKDITQSLWQSFMPERKEILNYVGNDLIAMQVYPKDYFKKFDFKLKFEKWATLEVSNFDYIPKGMKSFTISSGEYAVFLHKGGKEEASKTYMYIFKEWLPNSEYDLDFRPHFEILGEKYKRNSPSSEEEIYIPIVKKV